MKKIISLILITFLLFPIGVSASDTVTFNIDGKKITTAWYEYKWVDVNGNKYLINIGKIIKGWRFDRDRTNDKYGDLIRPLSAPYWYYFDENGKMLTNVIVDGYIIDKDGKSRTDINHNDLNRGQNGEFAKTIIPIVPGWKKINEKWYYFNNDLELAHDTYINGYYVDSNGVWINN